MKEVITILNDKEISILERISNNKRYTRGRLSDEYKITISCTLCDA